MNNQNLQITVKTKTGKSILNMSIDAGASDETIGAQIRSLFGGSLRSAGGDGPRYVIVEPMA